MPPAFVGDEVVVPSGAESVVVGDCVVAPPESGGDVVGEDHVNGVVTSGQQQEDHSAEGGQEGDPVEQDESPW